MEPTNVMEIYTRDLVEIITVDYKKKENDKGVLFFFKDNELFIYNDTSYCDSWKYKTYKPFNPYNYIYIIDRKQFTKLDTSIFLEEKVSIAFENGKISINGIEMFSSANEFPFGNIIQDCYCKDDLKKFLEWYDEHFKEFYNNFNIKPCYTVEEGLSYQIHTEENESENNIYFHYCGFSNNTGNISLINDEYRRPGKHFLMKLDEFINFIDKKERRESSMVTIKFYREDLMNLLTFIVPECYTKEGFGNKVLFYFDDYHKDVKLYKSGYEFSRVASETYQHNNKCIVYEISIDEFKRKLSPETIFSNNEYVDIEFYDDYIMIEGAELNCLDNWIPIHDKYTNDINDLFKFKKEYVLFSMDWQGYAIYDKKYGYKIIDSVEEFYKYVGEYDFDNTDIVPFIVCTDYDDNPCIRMRSKTLGTFELSSIESFTKSLKNKEEKNEI